MPGTVAPGLVIGDLAVHDMQKNHELARAISDAAWRELRSMPEWEMPLNVRERTCATCGTTRDRDGDAAVNPLAGGPAVTSCGAGARPHRVSSSRSGRSVVKQESPLRGRQFPPSGGGFTSHQRTTREWIGGSSSRTEAALPPRRKPRTA